MERRYWIGRMDAAQTAARDAATAESRLIHYDLAGRYSIKAAGCLPFLLASAEPATAGERMALQLTDPPGEFGDMPALPGRPKLHAPPETFR